MKFFESFKKADKKIEQDNTPIHEEIDRKNNPTKSLETDIYQPEITEEEVRLISNDPEKKFIPIEDIPDDVDWQDYMVRLIDWEELESNEFYSDDEELAKLEKIEQQKDLSYDDEPQTSSAKPRYPQEVKQIIIKYSLPNYKWNELSQNERKEIKNKIQTEIQELYIKKPKKMVRKSKEKSSEKAA